jgi:succinate dehydrogenase / fumarate reductase cytochrome b subunit
VPIIPRVLVVRPISEPSYCNHRKNLEKSPSGRQQWYPIVKDKRPVNLDIGTIRLPITAWASITHRATGVILFVGMAILLWALESSLSGPQGFAEVAECLSNPLVKLILWGIVSAGIYHSLAGIKHLIMDFGYGESMEGGVLGVRIVVGASAVLILLAGVWIW